MFLPRFRVLFLILTLSFRWSASFAFSLLITPPKHHIPKLWTRSRNAKVCSRQLFSSFSKSTDKVANNGQSDDDHDHDDDDESSAVILQTVTIGQLAKLCNQFGLSQQGDKEELLTRLRDYAKQQAHLEQQRRLERVKRVEQGEDSKERYEILSSQPEEDDEEYEEEDDAIFYYPLPDDPSTENTENRQPKQQQRLKRTTAAPLTSPVVTAPPRPDHVNEHGERVVTIYSSTEHNDLTGVAAAQPGKVLMDSLDQTAGGGGGGGMSSSTTSTLQAFDRSSSSSSATTASTTTSKQMEQAKEEVIELVQYLLAMTGAPAYAALDHDDDDDDEDDDDFDNQQSRNMARTNSIKTKTTTRPGSFVGFQPATVPTQLLVASSKALRTGRGQVLQEVLRQFELQAIGQDGMAGDNRERGGGHYREVSKVRAFLEGYRKAEVRRIARETAALLLDKIVQEGVEGLDLALSTMVRSGDDTSEHAGELNDSLLDYLNDSIRQQEKKVNLIRKSSSRSVEVPGSSNDGQDSSDDRVASLWTVESEDGQRVETIDPNDPKVKKVLQDEYSKAEELSAASSSSSLDSQVPSLASEKLLLLLKLLRQRIEAEAAFAPDEKGRNLRLLAYCLRLTSSKEREQLILKETGSSLDRLDSFMELVASSIEYSESTSHQLQPSKTMPLNVRQLKGILELSQKLRKQQSLRTASAANLTEQ